MRPFDKRKLVIGILIILSTSLFVNLCSYSGIFDKMENMAFDARSRIFSRGEQVSDDVAVILIDEASLRLMNPVVGRWPWPRSVYADVIDFLSMGGARAVLFDILFTENERVPGLPTNTAGPNDLRLAEATASAGNVYHAANLIIDKPDEYNRGLLNRPLPPDFIELFSVKGLTGMPAGENNTYEIPIKEVYRGAKRVGIVQFGSDMDGIFRRTRLFRHYQGDFFPVLPVAPVLDVLETKKIRVEAGSLIISGEGGKNEVKIPVHKDGSYLVKMYGDFNPYSMSGVLASIQKIKKGELEGLPVNPADFRDKVVFIGASAVGVEDLKPTSIGKDKPGVFLHASVYSNIVKKDFLRNANPLLSVFSVFALSLTVALSILWIRNMFYQIVIPLILALFYISTSFWLFKNNVVYDIVAPASSIVFSWMGAFAYLSFTEGKDKKKIKKMLGQYVSPAILTVILDKGPKDVLTAEVGSRERLTVMFSDIRGFTSISEALEAEKVVDILNGYLSGMVDVIFRHEGTLDKFIGDAIMAFWGAPVKVNDHGRRAVTAALEMVCQLEVVNEGVIAKGLAPISIGIGINTGDVILGNIGSEKKLDYTVIGDNVNLASRMEGLTKLYGCPVLITEATYEDLKGEIPCRVVDLVRVKGKNRPVKIYEPVGLLNEYDLVVSLSQEGFNCYLDREWEKAKRLYSELLTIKEGDVLAGIFIKRCADYIENEPSVEWDGVYTMIKK